MTGMPYRQADLFNPQRSLFAWRPPAVKTVRLWCGVGEDEDLNSIVIPEADMAGIHDCRGVEDDAWCKSGCGLAYSCHPNIEHKPGVFTKYCTAEVIARIPAARPLVRRMIRRQRGEFTPDEKRIRELEAAICELEHKASLNDTKGIEMEAGSLKAPPPGMVHWCPSRRTKAQHQLIRENYKRQLAKYAGQIGTMRRKIDRLKKRVKEQMR